MSNIFCFFFNLSFDNKIKIIKFKEVAMAVTSSKSQFRFDIWPLFARGTILYTGGLYLDIWPLFARGITLYTTQVGDIWIFVHFLQVVQHSTQVDGGRQRVKSQTTWEVTRASCEQPCELKVFFRCISSFFIF